MSKYDDIINLSRPKSKHGCMSMEERAAQFSPFASLKGYNDSIDETCRYTDSKIILDEDERKKINYKLQEINTNIKKQPIISIKYFTKDKRKSGGIYSNYTGKLKKIDLLNRKLEFFDGIAIFMDDIIDIAQK